MHKTAKILLKIAAFSLALVSPAAATLADRITVKLHSLQHPQQNLGSVVLEDIPYGLLIIPDLKHLPPGMHGFHVHTNPSCADHGQAAGGHLDPGHVGKHLGPYNPYGHLGDLPQLYVNAKGMAKQPLLAPRLTVALAREHSLIIHSGGDNFSDYPEKLGGGGVRIACGVIK